MTVELGRAHNRGRRSGGMIEIDLGRSRRVRVGSDNNAAELWRVLDALETHDPAPVRRAGVTGDRPYRHAQSFSSLSLIVQETLKRDPHGGHLFVFRGVIWHDRQNACLYTKRLDRGLFPWPSVADEAVTISTAQFAYLLFGID